MTTPSVPCETGLVLGTREATPLQFWVGVHEDQYLQLDDVVYLEMTHPISGEPLRFYGLVDEVAKKFEGLNFDSDTGMVHQGLLPASLSHLAHVTITRIDPEIFIPPHPGTPVYRATAENYDTALCFDQMERKLPAGLLQSGDPAFLNFDFIDGTKGGHVSISGISGVATKTSYTLFLLHGIFNGRTIPAETRKHARAVIFNVKNEDLFFLDKPNTKLRPQDRAAYERLGLPVQPFQDVAFYAPCDSASGEIVPSTRTRTDVRPYGWTLRQIAENNLLTYLFNEVSHDSVSNLSFVVESVSNRLLECARDKHERMVSKDGFNQPLNSLQDLAEHLHGILDDDDDERQQHGFKYWFGRNHTGTVRAFLRRFDAALRQMSKFVRPDLRPEHTINWKDQHLTVIDISLLSGQAQLFVVGSVLDQILDNKINTGDRTGLFIVLDELNRYAPRNGGGPIKDKLLDIAERGRSMGLILLGAQQTASEVEKRVVSNAAIRVNGRLDAAEASAKEYGYLQGAFRQRALMIRPGTMIVQQPELPSPVLVHVPMPAWATRKSETPPEEIIVSGESLFGVFQGG
jgi:DNA helicase HerA-like ATPase